jgi:hypothetical protein
MSEATAGNGTGLEADHRAGKRRAPTKEGSPNLFYLWHKLQELKAEAEQMKDAELVFMIGLVELLVEERATPGGLALAEVDTTIPH